MTNMHHDIIGMQHDIMGNMPGAGYGAFARPGNPAAMMPYGQQCPPAPPPPNTGAGGFWGPGGPMNAAAMRAAAFGMGGLPGFAQRSGDFSFAYPPVWPGADPEAAAAVQAAYGPCAFPPWPSCFGPPPNPLLVQKTQQPAYWVEPRCPTDIRTEPLGLPEECIQPCETVRLACKVCTTTKIVRLVIPWDICDQLVFEDINVGKDSIVNGCGGIPACMFAPDATDAFHVDWPTIQDGGCIEFVVKNISGAPVCFRGGAWARVFVY